MGYIEKKNNNPPKYIPMENRKPLGFWKITELLRDFADSAFTLELELFFQTNNNKNKNKDFDENGLGFKKKNSETSSTCVGFYQNQHGGKRKLVFFVCCFMIN